MEMKKTDVKNIITYVVTKLQGCKGTELVCQPEFISVYKAGFDLVEIIEEMIKENELIEIEYTIPQLDYRVKSFYLPKGSKLESWGAVQK